jgi:hypothetical protein
MICKRGHIRWGVPGWEPGDSKCRVRQCSGMSPEDELGRLVDAVLELAVVLGLVVVTA